jgi:hypothetical protein
MKRTLESGIAKLFAMSDETWQRHANPWSFWTRFTILPLLIIAIWSRAWVGFWSIPLIVAAVAWTWLNPRVFARPSSTANWASKGVLGERVWLNRNKVPVPEHHLMMPKILSGVSGIALPFIIWGFWQLELWPTLVGCILVYAGKLWFIDRMVWLYEDMKNADPQYAGWLYNNGGEQGAAPS